MPTDRIEFPVEAPMADAMNFCREAVRAEGWMSAERADNRLEVKPPRRIGTWPVTLDVNLVTSDTQTVIRVDGRIAGWGPIQKNQLGQCLNTFQSRVVGLAMGSS